MSFDEVKENYGFVPLNFTGAFGNEFEDGKYIINERGFVMIGKKNQRKTQGHIIPTKFDKDGRKYVELVPMVGQRQKYYIDDLLRWNKGELKNDL